MKQLVMAVALASFGAALLPMTVDAASPTVATGSPTNRFTPNIVNINPGDTIRLNYDIDPLPGYTSATTNLTTGINYAFNDGLLKGLNLYARYSQANQSISTSAG